MFATNFLDEIVTDKLRGAWSVQADARGSTAIIRNHEWYGYTAYHTSGTNEYGNCYIGEGIKNADLAF